MSQVVKFPGLVKKGKFIPYDEAGLKAEIAKLEGKEISISVHRNRKQRSLSQNSYYWKIIVGMIGDQLGYTKDQTHKALCAHFLKADGPLPTHRTSSELDTQEMEWYHEKIRRWAAEFLGIAIPSPERVA